MKRDSLAAAWSFAIFVGLAAVPVSAQEKANPYRAARVGEWAVYKTRFLSSIPSLSMSYEEKRTIAENDGKTAKIRCDVTYADGKKTSRTRTVDLTAAFPLKGLLDFEPDQFDRIKLVLSKEGKEAIAVGDKELASSWSLYNVNPGGLFSSKRQIWLAKEAPFGGLVKLQSTSRDFTSTTTLVEFGSAKEAGAKPKKSAPVEVLTNTIGQRLVFIPSGEFIMGAMPKPDFLRKAYGKQRTELLELFMREPPSQPRAIPRGFRMSAHEVTIGQFKEFVKATKYVTDAERTKKGGTGLTEHAKWTQSPEFTWSNYGFDVGDNHPVANVTWKDSVAFCAWLSKKEGRTYRLPTEPEWEYACRAGSTTVFFPGDRSEKLEGHANVADRTLKRTTPGIPHTLEHNDGFAYTAPVGKFKANAWGLYDMHGNVLEWCGDRFSAFDPLKDTFQPPEEPKEELYVLRGGNWFNEPWRAGSACRTGAEPTKAMSLIGFRIVLEVPTEGTDAKPMRTPKGKVEEKKPDDLSRFPFGQWATPTKYVHRMAASLTIQLPKDWEGATPQGVRLYVVSTEDTIATDPKAELDPVKFSRGFVFYAKQSIGPWLMGMEIHRLGKDETVAEYVERKEMANAASARRRPGLIGRPATRLSERKIDGTTVNVLDLASDYRTGGFYTRTYFFVSGNLVYDIQFGSSRPLNPRLCDTTLAEAIDFKAQ